MNSFPRLIVDGTIASAFGESSEVERLVTTKTEADELLQHVSLRESRLAERQPCDIITALLPRSFTAAFLLETPTCLQGFLGFRRAGMINTHGCIDQSGDAVGIRVALVSALELTGMLFQLQDQVVIGGRIERAQLRLSQTQAVENAARFNGGVIETVAARDGLLVRKRVAACGGEVGEFHMPLGEALAHAAQHRHLGNETLGIFFNHPLEALANPSLRLRQ